MPLLFSTVHDISLYSDKKSTGKSVVKKRGRGERGGVDRWKKGEREEKHRKWVIERAKEIKSK